ncbi:MAG: hypothetical protein MUE44_24375 [Oscillatoriaceae cyanobacterium Prado104]|nr:hypothetical protein [Oscillatoriaceae cyanobacterium Prado104]
MEDLNILCSRPAWLDFAGRLGFEVFLRKNSSVSGALEEDRPSNSPEESEQEILQIRVVGSRRSVFKTIHHLYLLGFAAVGDWSPPQPGSKPGEFISVLIRRSSKA